MNPDPKRSSATNSHETEPTAGFATVPMWLIVLFGVAFYLGQIYVDKNSGQFSALVYYPYGSKKDIPQLPGGEENLFDLGKEYYARTCAACHQPHGKGQPGIFPPLAGSEWVTTPGTGRLIRIALNSLLGEIKVAGEIYNNPAMPQWKDILSDKDIAAILTYIRADWGNKAGPVKPEEVAAIRAQTKDRAENWTVEELSKIPETE